MLASSAFGSVPLGSSSYRILSVSIITVAGKATLVALRAHTVAGKAVLTKVFVTGGGTSGDRGYPCG